MPTISADVLTLVISEVNERDNDDEEDDDDDDVIMMLLLLLLNILIAVRLFLVLVERLRHCSALQYCSPVHRKMQRHFVNDRSTQPSTSVGR